MTTTEEQGFLAAIADSPADITARLAYIDWLDEHDRPADAADERACVQTRMLAREIAPGYPFEIVDMRAWFKARISSCPIHELMDLQKQLKRGTSNTYDTRSLFFISNRDVVELLRVEQVKSMFRTSYGGSFLPNHAPNLAGLREMFVGMGFPQLIADSRVGYGFAAWIAHR